MNSEENFFKFDLDKVLLFQLPLQITITQILKFVVSDENVTFLNLTMNSEKNVVIWFLKGFVTPDIPANGHNAHLKFVLYHKNVTFLN